MVSISSSVQDIVNRAASLAELRAYEHSDFVRCAYLTVLGRLPDPEGMDYYLTKLGRGVAKLTILRQLRFSPEGRSHDPGIAGFDRALRNHRRGNLPVVGWLFRLFRPTESDSGRSRRYRALERRLMRIEARLLAVHIDCLDRLEGLQAPASRKTVPFGLVPAGQRSARAWMR